MKTLQRFLPVGESALGTNQISTRIWEFFSLLQIAMWGLFFHVYSLSISKGWFLLQTLFFVCFKIFSSKSDQDCIQSKSGSIKKKLKGWHFWMISWPFSTNKSVRCKIGKYWMWYIKREMQCFITRWNAEKRVKNTTHSGVFWRTSRCFMWGLKTWRK